MSQKICKYVFISGGVSSSLGKGILASALGSLLELNGIKIAFQKMDPYLNVDAGTMSPYQHGEVFVTEDGAETDLDLGNYERFTNFNVRESSSVTTGKVYQEVIRKERQGEYLGQTVQVIPHITNAIKDRIHRFVDQQQCDVMIIEIGGTVGDIESFPYLEAIRQFRQDVGKENVLVIHLTLVPIIGAGEAKTKPTQHSVRELRYSGLQPDLIVCRSSRPLSQEAKEKIALFCNVHEEDVLEALDAKTSIYELPIAYHQAGLDKAVINKLGLFPYKEPDISSWKKIVNILKSPEKTVRIAVVGKYTKLEDTYKSLYQAIAHGGIANKVAVHVDKVEADEIQDITSMSQYQGIIIPGGFGERGVEAMIEVAKYARIHKIPLLGICYGMQIMCIEYARNILGYSDATTEEIHPESSHLIISLMENQKQQHQMGGTMRLGSYTATLKPGTLIHSLYQSQSIVERHRHRFEFNNEYLQPIQDHGLIISGMYQKFLVETVELPDHPWGIGVQFHPELISKPYKPHPLFGGFIKACLDQK